MNPNVKHWIYHLRYEYEIGFVVYWLLRIVKRILKISFFIVKTILIYSLHGRINFVLYTKETTLCFLIHRRRTATHISPVSYINTRTGNQIAIYVYTKRGDTRTKRKSYCLLAYNSFSANEVEMFFCLYAQHMMLLRRRLLMIILFVDDISI